MGYRTDGQVPLRKWNIGIGISSVAIKNNQITNIRMNPAISILHGNNNKLSTKNITMMPHTFFEKLSGRGIIIRISDLFIISIYYIDNGHCWQ